MNKIIKTIFICIFLFCCFNSFSQITYQDLLKYRLKNDSLYTTIENDYIIAKNNYNQVILNSYLATNFSTGDINFNLSSDHTKSQFSINPSASLSSPVLNNLSLTFSAPYNNLGNGIHTSQGFNFGLSFDIYSQAFRQHKLQIKNSKESFKLQEENLIIRNNLIEKKLLEEIIVLFSEYNKLISGKLSIAQSRIRFQQVKAEGYQQSSPKLTTAKFTLMRAEREQKEIEFNFWNTLEIFMNNVNFQITKNDIDNFFNTLIQSIPKVKLVKTEKLINENYKPIINAENNFQNKNHQDKIQLNPFTAAANLSVSNLTQKKLGYPLLKTKTKNISGGVTMSFSGFKIYSGATFNLESKKKSNPVLQFNLSFNPLDLYAFILNVKNIKLNQENSKIKMQEIKTKLKIEFKELLSKRKKIEWQQKMYSEELKLYQQNMKEYKKLFSQGIISKLEKEQAALEYQQAVIRDANSNIDVMLFNIEILQKFRRNNEN